MLSIGRMMSIGSTTLVFILLPYRFALADNSQTPGPAPANPGQNLPHLNLYNLKLPRFDDKPPDSTAHGSETNAVQGKPSESNTSGGKLHWTTIDSRPGVSYQLDKNQDVRVHLGGHGAVASFALHF